MKLTSDFIKKIESHKDFDLFLKVIFPKVMQWEGGSKLHKLEGDAGGWTKWGVAYNFWKHIFENFEDFKDTTLDEASYFAFDKFYLPIHAELVPRDCKLYYFDTAYNMGTDRAIKLMQECIGVKPDGKIGNITKSKMHLLTESCLKSKRDSFYKSLAGRTQRLQRFLKGWLNRSNDVFKHYY